MCETASGALIRKGVHQMPVRHTLGLFCLLTLSACGGGTEQNATGNAVEAPTAGSASAGGAQQGATPAASGTILEGVTRSADHSNLLAALKAAGLDRVLSGAGPYTLFAPTNAGFAKLPAGTAEGLMRAESKAQLTELLASHVVPGVVTASDLRSAMQRKGGKTELATVGGAKLSVAEAGGALVVTDAKGGQARVTGGEGLHSNGVLHGVDAVLMPK
jgi:uncharacterized surface protein with fasciclin (FAS1) repeats